MPLTRTHSAIILFAFFLVGCGGPRLKSVPVRGKVVGPTGKSVGAAAIIFWPKDSKNNSGAGAICEADGSFHLECLPGNYKATVSPIRPKGATAPPQPQASVAQQPDSTIPIRFQNELTTTLTVTVPETGTDDVILNLK